ncbi:uncharacterized protein KY384_002955 [Bacidia gigantensis]|uniref:uncharacterized protein n=1 Tax=Bacidia gigantensis TaxID=2732470 RepID=UPI001D03643D|nr:uncharacterized protein KY384_002955 [Bacidia gigantensis]KAG8531326.1 hypothetical protein KY384_002955 [Bacidia gigantensis]
MNMDIPSNAFGTLSKLPAEIRHLIYENIVLGGFIACDRTKGSAKSFEHTQLGILSVNSAIHAEVQDTLRLHGQYLIEVYISERRHNVPSEETLTASGEAYGHHAKLRISFDGCWPNALEHEPSLDQSYPNDQKREWLASLARDLGVGRDLKHLEIEIPISMRSISDDMARISRGLHFDTFLKQLQGLSSVTINVTCHESNPCLRGYEDRIEEIKSMTVRKAVLLLQGYFVEHLGPCYAVQVCGSMEGHFQTSFTGKIILHFLDASPAVGGSYIKHNLCSCDPEIICKCHEKEDR